jgi:mono/diheme cytochrome c family protein
MRGALTVLGLAGIATAAIALAPAKAATQLDGAATYKRCAACHLPTGAGVPGAFPPLGADVRQLSQTAAGRNYLALVVIKGVSGPLTVEGKTYRGSMPAQADLDDASVAALLNYVATKVAKGNSKAFTPIEIAAARKSGAGLNSSAVGKLHEAAGRK